MQKNVFQEDLTVRQQGLKWPLFFLDSDASSVCGLLDFPNTTKHNRRSVMQSILPWVGIVILFLTGWAVVKKYQVNMVLLLGGLALNVG